jgi:hypothetical protein
VIIGTEREVKGNDAGRHRRERTRAAVILDAQNRPRTITNVQQPVRTECQPARDPEVAGVE